MSMRDTWDPGLPADYPDGDGPPQVAPVFRRDRDGTAAGGGPKDRAATWVGVAGIGLGVLAATAAVVSWAAQYQMVYAYKHTAVIAALQASIPDAGALVFAALGIAQALDGKRALRARALNVACVGLSIAMNALAASAGFKALSIWVMAPVVYALASDTLIGVIRSHAIKRQRELREDLADDEASALAIVGAIARYGLRLLVAPPSTVMGGRRALLVATPLPGPEAAGEASPAPAGAAPPAAPRAALTAVPAARSRRPAKPRSRAAGRPDEDYLAEAREAFADELADGAVPGVKRIQAVIGGSQERAARIQGLLRPGVES